MQKYIVMINNQSCEEEIFTFPITIDHDAMFEAIYRVKNNMSGMWSRNWRIPVSAGFINSVGECHGESITMNLTSRGEEDTLLL